MLFLASVLRPPESRYDSAMWSLPRPGYERETLRAGALTLVVALALVTHSTATAKDATDDWSWPDFGPNGENFAPPPGKWGELVAFGRELVMHTYAHIGPEVADQSMRYAGNNLACQSCHLQAGTWRFGLPFVGVFVDYPRYQPRAGAVVTLEDRINECMMRSMNGKPLPLASREIKAFVVWFKYLSDGIPVGRRTEGQGSATLALLDHRADPEKGARVYAQYCAACHMPNGQGRRAGVVGDAKGYAIPPLWGPDSYNNGAGMARLVTAAAFVHSNMPQGTTWDAPAVSVEDAWDVTAYMESQSRPQAPGLAADYPNAREKPVDAAYGPYKDGFSADQHKYGPFGPIEAARESGSDAAR